jgi:hypothetical protein
MTDTTAHGGTDMNGRHRGKPRLWKSKLQTYPYLGVFSVAVSLISLGGPPPRMLVLHEGPEGTLVLRPVAPPGHGAEPERPDGHRAATRSAAAPAVAGSRTGAGSKPRAVRAPIAAPAQPSAPARDPSSAYVPTQHAANGTLAIFRGVPSGWAIDQATAAGIGVPTWAGAGDFDGNGYDDLAWYHASNGTIAVFYGTPNGWSLRQATAEGIGAPTWAGVGDYNGDGRDDLAWHE